MFLLGSFLDFNRLRNNCLKLIKEKLNVKDEV